MKSSCHILYFEAQNEKEYLELNRYILYLIRCILSINNYQVLSGVSIIKIDNITFKPIIDLVYLISGMYEKSYIIFNKKYEENKIMKIKKEKDKSNSIFNKFMSLFG